MRNDIKCRQGRQEERKRERERKREIDQERFNIRTKGE